eukprot:gb/GEZN01011021.1/.p1 GENE.gb/GEZN01011021.1/~~gb/GEZN01011021.1/.p1  ORF type:complete len:383 (+),score=60.73 gb/GEZN01011021.1/:171-1151(+)
MLFVSFSEIMSKSRKAFMQAGHKEGHAYALSVLCFFGGFALMVFLNLLVHCLDPKHTHEPAPLDADLVSMVEEAEAAVEEEVQAALRVSVPGTPVKSTVSELEDANVGLDSSATAVAVHLGKIGTVQVVAENWGSNLTDVHEADRVRKEEEEAGKTGRMSTSQTSLDSEKDPDHKRLSRMGLNTAVAIAIHNFPEGLATFVATLADPVVGVSLAIAIALHNIPEGLCVSIPVYYATHNRKKAFLWGILSGATEPIGAIAGYLILMNTLTPTAFAILFGLVAGMMVLICLKELLPTAHRYDPEDKVVTTCTVAGMLMMATSLVLFVI